VAVLGVVHRSRGRNLSSRGKPTELPAVDDRYRFDLDQAARMSQRLYPDQRVDGLVISEQRFAARLDRWQVLVTVINDEDGDLGHLVRPGTRGSESTADVVERLARLNRQITRTDEFALPIFGDLPSDENQPAPGRDDDVGVRLGRSQVSGIDAFEWHGVGGA
jgi:hypothetical protein